MSNNDDPTSPHAPAPLIERGGNRVGSHHQTDLSNARAFVTLHGAQMRYCHDQRQWLVFDGRRWAEDHSGEAERRAKATTQRLWKEVAKFDDQNTRIEIARQVAKSESARGLDAMLKLAKSEPEIALTSDRLDDQRATRYRLNVMNGTMDLREGVLSRHDPNDLITKLAPVAYDPTTVSPTWEAFLARVLPDSEVRAFLQRAVGYSATGSIEERAFFILHGGGANGKSTFLEAIRHVLGDYARTTAAEAVLTRRDEGASHDLARLKGARFVTASETNEGRRLDEARIKAITGGEAITARRLYHEAFEFVPTFSLWLATNHVPDIHGTDDGIWDRIHLIPFTQRIPEGERDPRLLDKLRSEAEGMLAWLVEGAKQWADGGLRPPAAVRRAVQVHRSDMDCVGQFLEECCDRSDLTAFTSADELRRAYAAWAEVVGEAFLSKQRLGRRLKDAGLASDRRMVSGREQRGWIGVRVIGDTGEVQTAAD